MLLINVCIQFNVFDRKDYDFGANALVLTCIFASIYTLRNMNTTKWFGSSVEGGHAANITISKIFGLVCLIPALFMNIHPLLKALN